MNNDQPEQNQELQGAAHVVGDATHSPVTTSDNNTIIQSGRDTIQVGGDPDTSLLPAQPEQDEASAQGDHHAFDRQGGDHIHTGNITGTGIAVGAGSRVDVTITEEQAYKVAGLANPYLGLRAFTAAERDIFAGRERIVRALVDRLSAANGDRLLFIVGASGSGKSSLARAGLLPELADRMRTVGYDVQTYEIDHPGPLLRTTLIRFLTSIHPASDRSAPTFLLILIDQFEELFSQGDSTARGQILDLLAKVASSLNAPIRIIATMRSDFLPQLLADPRFEAAERRKVVVRAMTEDELRDAIQCPIQVLHPEKHIEPALLEELVKDAAVDAAYLPLLQVTLEDLWRRRQLRRDAYQGLADAIQRRADAVYTYRDYDGLQQEQRPSDEQKVILELFLALVRGSFYTNQPNVRWRRPRAELTQGDPDRQQLINDLINDLAKARLLRTDHELLKEDGHERVVETVDVVHETLLSRWKILSDAIREEQELLRRRERFDLARVEWLKYEKHDNYLLTGVRLAEAEALKQRGDGVFQRYSAQEFYERSLEVERRRAAYLEHLLERQRELTADIEDQLALAQSQALVFAAQGLAESEREIALLLAIEAVMRDHNPLSEQMLRDSLDRLPWNVVVLQGHTGAVINAQFSPDGERLLTVALDGSARLWDLEGKTITEIVGDDNWQKERQILNSAMFSPDGSSILTTSDGTARLWDCSGQLRLRFGSDPYDLDSDLESDLESAVFSSDGQHILTVARDGTARLWDRAGRMLGEILDDSDTGWRTPVRSAIFSPDGQHILTLSWKARLWDCSMRPLVTLGGTDIYESGRADSAVFSPDGQYILMTSAERVWLWDRLGKLRVELGEHLSPIRYAEFSRNGEYILTVASGDTENTLRVWNLHGRQIRKIQFPRIKRVIGESGIQRASFSPDGQHIFVIADNDSRVWIYNLSGELAAMLIGHRQTVHSVTFSPDGKRILTASRDCTARLWDWAGPPLPSLSGHRNRVNMAAFSANGQAIITASQDHSACIWSLSGTLLATLTGHTDWVYTAVLSQDGKHAVTASRDGTARLWNISGLAEDLQADSAHHGSGQLIATEGQQPAEHRADVYSLVFNGHAQAVLTAVFSRDGQFILTASEDETARLWSVNGNLLRTLTGHSHHVLSAVFSPNGQYILTASNDRTARLWDLAGQTIAILSDHTDLVKSAVFSPNGQRILTASFDRTARIWDLAGQTIVTLKGHTDRLWHAEFSLDGNHVATASNDGTARLWDATTGQELCVFAGHTEDVLKVAFSPDGQHILTASNDRTARLWHCSGEHRATFYGDGWIHTAIFSPDGCRILIASGSQVQQYLTSIDDVLKVAACRVGNGLNAEETRRFGMPLPLRFNITTRQCPPKLSWEK
jgi:WD40 repeat protein/ABC-type dipeptide/oligopeptide/nickel transport system ATPase component